MGAAIQWTVGAISMLGLYGVSFGMLAGWAFWMWMAIQFGSFGMFFFGLLGPLAFVAAFLGLWSLLFGAPGWLLALVF